MCLMEAEVGEEDRGRSEGEGMGWLCLLNGSQKRSGVQEKRSGNETKVRTNDEQGKIAHEKRGRKRHTSHAGARRSWKRSHAKNERSGSRAEKAGRERTKRRQRTREKQSD